MTTSPNTAFLTSVRPPSARQERLARVVTVLLVGTGLVTLMFRDVLLERLDAFVPIANTVVFLSGATTAVLLLGQFTITRKPALLALAAGYLVMALLIVSHTLTFPGVFSPTGLLGARQQTVAGLYFSQHFAFVLGAVAYTLLRRQGETRQPVAHMVTLTVAGSIVVAIGVTWIATVHHDLLPPIMAGAVSTSTWYQQNRPFFYGVVGLTSTIVFWKRHVSMTDLWLRVAVWSWLIETLLTAVVSSRYSLVFYVDRTLSVVSAAIVLLVLLSESLLLHARLLVSLAAREHEREGRRTEMDVMVGSIAHELRQPLSSIRANGYAGKLLTASAAPDLGEVKAIFDDISASVVRASDIIDSVRATFSASRGDWRAINANALVQAGVELTRLELETRQIACHVDLAADLPEIRGHRGQLLQVLVNGIANAADSVDGVTERPRLVRISTDWHEPNRISIIIEDSGTGIDPSVRHRIFEPFFSTKKRGMGLGLSICRTIVAAHRGTVTLVPGRVHGAVLRVDLPVLVAEENFRPRMAPRMPAPREEPSLHMTG